MAPAAPAPVPTKRPKKPSIAAAPAKGAPKSASVSHEPVIINPGSKPVIVDGQVTFPDPAPEGDFYSEQSDAAKKQSTLIFENDTLKLHLPKVDLELRVDTPSKSQLACWDFWPQGSRFAGTESAAHMIARAPEDLAVVQEALRKSMLCNDPCLHDNDASFLARCASPESGGCDPAMLDQAVRTGQFYDTGTDENTGQCKPGHVPRTYCGGYCMNKYYVDGHLQIRGISIMRGEGKDLAEARNAILSACRMNSPYFYDAEVECRTQPLTDGEIYNATHSRAAGRVWSLPTEL